MQLTLRQLNRATLARQLMLAREKTTALKAIERLVAMQAQIPRPPFIGLWTRVAGFERKDLAKLLERREVVRGTLLRGTLHLVTTKDFLAFRSVFSSMLEKSIASVLRDRAKGLDVRKVAGQATNFLEAGSQTFEEIRAHLVGLNPKVDERALGFAVRCALHLVQVPIEGSWSFPTDSQFALAQSWIGKPAASDPDPRPLVLRYLSAFGPASVADMQTWSGLKDLAGAFEALGPKLTSFTDPRGKAVFDLPKAPRPDEDTPAPVRFLPDYDNLVLGHADRTRVIADAHRPLMATKNLQVLPTFLVDGFVAGTWKIDRAKASATLTLKPFEKLGKKPLEALTVEGKALLKFVEPDAAKQAVRVA
jgi:hypothetical protein